MGKDATPCFMKATSASGRGPSTEAWFYCVTTDARVRAAGGKRSLENASKGVQKCLDSCLDKASQQSQNAVELHAPVFKSSRLGLLLYLLSLPWY